MKKKVKDTWGDPVTVSTHDEENEIELNIEMLQAGPIDALAVLSPGQAREIARALKKAARRVEASR